MIRGIPGTGKSTLAKKLSTSLGIKYYEADQFFINQNSEYVFDIQKLSLAHKVCITNTMAELINGRDVIVSNTSTTLREINNYIQMVFALSYETPMEVDIIDCTTHYGDIHNCPDDVIFNMKKRWKPISELLEFIPNNIKSKIKLNIYNDKEYYEKI